MVVDSPKLTYVLQCMLPVSLLCCLLFLCCLLSPCLAVHLSARYIQVHSENYFLKYEGAELIISVAITFHDFEPKLHPKLLPEQVLVICC